MSRAGTVSDRRSAASFMKVVGLYSWRGPLGAAGYPQRPRDRPQCQHSGGGPIAGNVRISRVLSRHSRGGSFLLGPHCWGPLAAYPGLNGAGRSSSLLGLAPGGVCRATPVAGSPVRSYRTVSPLPVHSLRRPSAVCSLWHFPSARAARALPGTLPCGARTFLRRRLTPAAGDPHSHVPGPVSISHPRV